MKRLKLLFTLAIPVLLMHDAQAQTSSRLVAAANWYNNGAIFKPLDSTAYTYTNPRGGDLMHTLKYNTATNWQVVSPDTVYSNNTTTYQQFDASNNIISQTNTVWNSTTSTWDNTTKTLYFYDATNRVDTMVAQVWGGSNWVNVSRDVYTYTAGTSSHLFSIQHQLWNSSTLGFDANTQRTFYYNVSGSLIQEIGQTYNSSTSTYNYTDKYDYTYTSANMPATTTYSVWTGGSWVAMNMYTYSYDASNNRTSELYQTYNTTTMAWDNVTLENFSSFVSGNPQLEIDQKWDTAAGGSWKNNLERTYSYNSYNQLVNSVDESWNVAGFWEHANGDRASNYYYETYSTAGVNYVAANGEVNIFPIPAQNTLNIKLNWNEAQAFTVAIYDMNGAVVRTWSVPATAQYTTGISTANFASGNYVVKIAGTNGQIVKQIVVAH
jgi:hypothetical protein